MTTTTRPFPPRDVVAGFISQTRAMVARDLTRFHTDPADREATRDLLAALRALRYYRSVERSLLAGLTGGPDQAEHYVEIGAATPVYSIECRLGSGYSYTVAVCRDCGREFGHGVEGLYPRDDAYPAETIARLDVLAEAHECE